MDEQPVKRRLWFIEVWEDNRELFKELFTHICFFAMLILALVLFHLVVNWLPYPQERKETIEAIDYYGIVTVLAIFTVVFIIKALYFEFRKMRK